MVGGRSLAATTTYTVNLSGAKDTAGNQMDPISWTFTTGSATGGCPCSPGDELSMLLCAHPRILVNEGPMEFCFEGRDTVLLLLSQSPCGNRARPCVPPPEASLV